MQEDKRSNNAPMSDEMLDSLLAQWANTEIEPPADFHASMMERLRREQQKLEQEKQSAKKQKGSVLPFLTRNKKWMSVAAAAVLVLCCIPVVQAQMDDTNRNPAYNALPGQTQVASNSDSLAETAPVQQETAVAPQPPKKFTGDGKKQQAVQTAADQQNTAPKTEHTTPLKPADDGKVQSKQPEQVAEPQPAAADSPTDNAQTPAIAAFSLEPEGLPIGSSPAGINGKQIRSMDETLQQTTDKLLSYEKAVADLTTKLEELQQDWQAVEDKRKASPDDAELQAQSKDLQEHIDTVKKEIEQLKKLIAEAKAE